MIFSNNTPTYHTYRIHCITLTLSFDLHLQIGADHLIREYIEKESTYEDIRVGPYQHVTDVDVISGLLPEKCVTRTKLIIP